MATRWALAVNRFCEGKEHALILLLERKGRSRILLITTLRKSGIPPVQKGLITRLGFHLERTVRHFVDQGQSIVDSEHAYTSIPDLLRSK